MPAGKPKIASTLLKLSQPKSSTPKRQYRRQSEAQSPSAKAHSAGLLPKAEEALEQVEE